MTSCWWMRQRGTRTCGGRWEAVGDFEAAALEGVSEFAHTRQLPHVTCQLQALCLPHRAP